MLHTIKFSAVQLKAAQVIALTMLLSACGGYDNPTVVKPAPVIPPVTTPAATTFSAVLSSANEVPAITVASSGSASVTATLDGSTLTVSGTYKGLTGAATLAHIHGPAAKGSAAGVMFVLTFKNDYAVGSGTLSGTASLSAEQITQLKDGLLYVNVHTAANGKGEIRDQLRLGDAPMTPPVTTPATTTFDTTLSSANEVPAVAVASQGSGTVSATFDGMYLTVNGTFKGLTGAATLAHIHGPASKTAAAAVMFPLTFSNDAVAGSGKVSGTVMLMGDQVTALKAGQLYINVHTAANGKGEIRGQLELPVAPYARR